MQAAKESGFCQRFLFISSLAARHPELSWYAKSKYVAEQRLAAMADEITLGVFRPTAVYGPGDKELKPLFDWMLRPAATTWCARYTALFSARHRFRASSGSVVKRRNYTDANL
ncbi:putative rmlD substrate binding domain protein [Escherichia coli]|nr:putative rmlD substrate binding domain protein [Escherichia coli]